ncbi:hypothetical protein NLI96_g11116 [Meripilus lineatus]|uniref:OPA3-like protein n=1 Tax=Meripilus lineatus TaxID=2056292 RepID=A0AAD5UUR9_9APHY|nr:hypothetical protein NLI96_g11116 [Physisporinus lineatus]
MSYSVLTGVCNYYRHPTFRNLCVSLAQRMYKTEIGLRTNLLGEPAKHVRPLSETKAIDNGANLLAEGFLFGVAAVLILGETWRSSRSQSKRRDNVNDQLESLQEKLQVLNDRLDAASQDFETRWTEEKLRNDELTRILERVVEIGLRGGWAEFEDTPLPLPMIQLAPYPHTRTTPGPVQEPEAPTPSPNANES